jgi:hypothetical protein
MRLAIVGSREAAFADVQPIIIKYIEKLKPELIISGGAEGVDSFAVKVAEQRAIQTLVFLPQITRWSGASIGKTGFKERNMQIAETCDSLLRIVSKRSTSYGSGWTRDRARELGKNIFEEQVP